MTHDTIAAIREKALAVKDAMEHMEGTDEQGGEFIGGAWESAEEILRLLDEAEKERAVLCSECKSAAMNSDCSEFKCTDRLCPAFGRIVRMGFGCTYGVQKERGSGNE